MTTLQNSLMRKVIPAAATLALTALAFAAPSPARAADIVGTAAAAPQFSTLVAAIKAAGLVDTLKGPGPFTVFAPTNAAFAKLPAGTVKALLNSPERLKAILTYHVIPGKITAKQAMSMKSPTSPPTVEGKTLRVTTRGGTVMVNGAKVIKANITADNGVIHAIDTVLVPGGVLNYGKTGSMAVSKAMMNADKMNVVAGHKMHGKTMKGGMMHSGGMMHMNR